MNSSRSDLIPAKAGGWKFLLDPHLAGPLFAGYCGLPTGEYPEGVVPVVSSANTEVRRFDYKGSGYYLKEYFFLSWKKHFKVARRGQRLIRVARDLSAFGFLTPRIVGIGKRGLNRRVVSEAVEDTRDIWQVLFPDMSQYRGAVDDGFVMALGLIVGRLHRCGFCHGDLRWRNVLARKDEDEWKFYFIDNDRTKRYRFGLPFRCRVKNLSQILFSGRLLDWPEQDWQIFLQGYSEASGLSVPSRNKLVSKVEKRVNKRSQARKLSDYP